MPTVGAFQAKTHLAELLDRVESGEEVVITRHGQPIARLVPFEPARSPSEVRKLISEIRRGRTGRDLRGVTVRELLDEGRRY